MREAYSSTVVSNNIWNLVLSKDFSLDLAEFETGFFSINAVGLEASLNVVENTEVLASLFDRDYILES